MSKFKIGDRVRVCEDLKLHVQYGHVLLCKQMAELKGKIVTIRNYVHGRPEEYLIEKCPYTWAGEMFKELSVATKLTLIYEHKAEDGQIIEVIKNLLSIIEYGLVEKPNHDCNNPDSMCDSECMIYADQYRILDKAQKIITLNKG